MQSTSLSIGVIPAASASSLENTTWDIDRDIIRGRGFDFSQKFLPDAMSRVDEIDFLDRDERRLLGQVQGRTYANLSGVLEHVASATRRQMRGGDSRGNATAPGKAAKIDEGLKHRQLFQRIDALIARGMPPGYRFMAKSNNVAEFVLARSTWAVLALNFHVELATQVHYWQSIVPDAELSALYKDILFFHWKEKSQRGAACEREWRCEDAGLTVAERDRAVNDWIELVQGVDALLLFQAPVDVDYFAGICRRTFSAAEIERLGAAMLCAYRWQHLASVAQESRFAGTLDKLVGAHRAMRIAAELAPVMKRWPSAAAADTSSRR